MGRSTSRRSWLRSVGILGFSGLAGVTSAHSDSRVISACTEIDERGNYDLSEDLVSGGDAPCIEITADNVVLDGRGHAIRNGSGVLVSGANVTVENLAVTGFQGIRYLQTRGGVIRNNTTRAESGIVLESTKQTLIEGNECSDDFDSILLLDNADGNVVRENDIYGEAGPVLINSTRNRVENNRMRGVEIGLVVDASKNLLRQNIVDNSPAGGILIRGDRNRLQQNVVRGALYDPGISLDGASENRLHRNEVTNGDNVGILLDDADDNRLTRNIVCGNEEGQIVVDEESTGNHLIKNDTDCDE